MRVMNINIVAMSNVLLIVRSRSGAILPLNIDNWEQVGSKLPTY
jgi:hypothetical protein